MNKGMIGLGIAGAIIVAGAGAAGAIVALNSGSGNNTVSASKEQPKEEVKLNGWKEENGSWYFYKDNEKQQNWVQDKNSWYYLGNDGKMRTGWIKDNGNWYYLNQDGTMAANTTIDNCYLNEHGLIENTPRNTKAVASDDSSSENNNNKQGVSSFEEAKNIILREDGQYIKKLNNEMAKDKAYVKLDNSKQETINDVAGGWKIPNEKCYSIVIQDYYNGEADEDSGVYLVGKDTGNVYIIPHQGCFSAYQIKNNQVVKKFRWPGPDEDKSPDWR